MNRVLLLLTAFASLAAASTAGAQPHWQQQVNSTINVTLTDSTHSLDGFIKIQYANHSPDTLRYIWIHCWPNAYKTDRTAFSENLIGNGRTDFYFSDINQRGYINHLEFRVDGQLARLEDHPRYIDIIKVLLPVPLPPGALTTLTTPFHVRLPDIFSRTGYHEGVYEISHWFPQPAVYDSYGWHPYPYLDQGGVYTEFGDFDVYITVPKSLVLAATGELQDASGKQEPGPPPTRPAEPTKTLHYRQTNSNDFAWFANRRFHTDHDTLRLASGRIIDLYSFYTPAAAPGWRHSLTDMKAAIRFRSALIGEYPYNTLTAVETRSNASYPSIVGISGPDSDSATALDRNLERQIGYNWFSAILGADAHRYPWMAAGLNTYYDSRYATRDSSLHRNAVNTQAVLEKDQPISTASEDFTAENYTLIAHFKTAIWLTQLENVLGTALFDSCMREYFRKEQFQHPYPDDLKAAFAQTSPASLVPLFVLPDEKGPVPPSPYHRKIELYPGFLPHTANRNYLNILPAAGFNDYDHAMVGALIHNFNWPPENWQLLLAPLYATVSHQLNGVFHFNYAWYPHTAAQPLAPGSHPAQSPATTHPAFRLIEAGINASRFSTISSTDSNAHTLFGAFYKVVPYLRLFFPKKSPRDTRDSWLEWKTYLIGEKSFNNYVLKSTDSLYYPTSGKYDFRYLNQLSFTILDTRVLYPYKVALQVQQAAPFYRINLAINYFFNYETGGGLGVRLFGAKFGYLGSINPAQDLTPFEPKLTAVRGSEDYTYDNYFIGRNEYNGLASQQILMRDGDLKIRTDLFEGLQGRSDNWVAAVNLNSTLPPQIIPAWLPLKLFLDVGTYAEAWGNAPPTSHFLYVSGFELSFLHDVLRIYIPLVYSSDFSSQLKTVPGQNGFFQKLSFSMDFQNLPFRKTFGYTPF